MPVVITLKAKKIGELDGFDIEYREEISARTQAEAVAKANGSEDVVAGIHAVRNGVSLGGVTFPGNGPMPKEGSLLWRHAVREAEGTLAGILACTTNEDLAADTAMACCECGLPPRRCSCDHDEVKVVVGHPDLIKASVRLAAIGGMLDRFAPLGQVAENGPGGWLPFSDCGRISRAMDQAEGRFEDGMVYAIPKAAADAAARSGKDCVVNVLASGSRYPKMADVVFSVHWLANPVTGPGSPAFMVVDGKPVRCPDTVCLVVALDGVPHVLCDYADEGDLAETAAHFARMKSLDERIGNPSTIAWFRPMEEEAAR